MSGSNHVGPGRRISVEANYRAYDALHPRLREVVRRAPFDLHVPSWTKLFLGLPVEAARRVLIQHLVDRVAKRTLDTYGSDHPQAAPSSTPLPPVWMRKEKRRAASRRRS